MAFKPSSGANGGMSVDLEALMLEAGLDVQEYVTRPRWIGSLVVSAGAARSAGLLVGYAPLEDNPYHGEVWGTFNTATQRALRSACSWLVAIPDVEIG
jgi:hypothetical protein